MKFFIDNNLSPNLAAGMKAFQEPVIHLRDIFQPDAPDVDWLKYIGTRGWFLITRDLQTRKKPAELQSIRDNAVGAFYLGGKNLNHCQLIRQLVRNWPRIKELAKKTAPPFAFRVPPRGTKFERYGL